MKRIPVLTTLTALLALWTIAVFGQTFPGIHLQGSLTDLSGNPVEGTVNLNIRFYRVEVGGIPAYSETFNNLTINKGLLDITLGLSVGDPDSIKRALAATPAEPERWVGISVNSDPELVPRIRLHSTPHSFRVGTVDGATGGVISGDVSIEGSVATIKSIAVHPSDAGMTGLVIQGAPGQTAPLMEIKNSAGTPLVSVAPDGLVATPAIQLSGPSPTLSNFPNPVPIEIKTGMGSVFIGRNDGRLQQVAAALGAPVTLLQEWKNGSGTPVASISPSGNFQASGGAEIGGQDLLVTTGGSQFLNPVGIGTAPSTSPDVLLQVESGGTLHEFGHNLGLRHLVASSDDFLQAFDETGSKVASIDASGNFMANHISAMGYGLQLGGISTNGDLNVGGNVGIGVAIPHSPLQVGGSIALNLTKVTQTDCGLTLDKFHSIVIVDYAAVAPDTVCTINLPTAAGIKGRQYTIKRARYVATPLVAIDPYLSETIDNGPLMYLATPGNYATIVSDGANWQTIAFGNSP